MRDALSMFDKAVSFCGTTLDYRNVAQTLNVLDYDTYFGITEMLLAGDYVGALVSFDAVLAKGFSGQTFMAGLNRHMRDLLMASRPETLQLIEMTGTLLERYRTQAGACSVDFLFGAISVLTDIDGKIRQSSNQRLLVELGLMKIAGLGQKKNNPLTSPEAYPLPDLQTPTAPAATGAPAATAPAAAPAAATARSATSAGATPTPPAAGVSRPAAPSPGTAVTASPQETAPGPGKAQPTGGLRTVPNQPAPRTQAAAPAHNTPARPARRPLLSGTSLTELLASGGMLPEEEHETEGQADEPATAEIDPECTAKLERGREAILALIRERRPRFVPVFEQMAFHDNTIGLSVPTTELRDEILRSKTAMLMRIAEVAGITGRIELEITVDEQIRAARPIKLEDRVKFITEKNPLVAELRKALDLEIE